MQSLKWLYDFSKVKSIQLAANEELIDKILTLKSADPLNTIFINEVDIDIPDESAYRGKLEFMDSHYILNVSEFNPLTEPSFHQLKNHHSWNWRHSLVT